MVEIKHIKNKENFKDEISKKDFIDFLHKHLGPYRDSKKDIEKAINYAFSNSEGKGGFLLAAIDNDKIIGEVVINDSGMSGYIPEHVLVYIAVHERYRGKGIGRLLLDKTADLCDGNIKLHVEYDNPAVHFYENFGFKSKYAEMRYSKDGDT